MSEDDYVSSCSSLYVCQHQQVLWDLSMIFYSILNQRNVMYIRACGLEHIHFHKPSRRKFCKILLLIICPWKFRIITIFFCGNWSILYVWSLHNARFNTAVLNMKPKFKWTWFLISVCVTKNLKPFVCCEKGRKNWQLLEEATWKTQ